MLDTFRTLIHPSSGAWDFSIVSPHWLCLLLSMCVGVSVWLVGVVSVWQASACHTDTTTQPVWWYNKKVAGSWWWMCEYPKHVEHRRSEIILHKLWHQFGLLFFSYHYDARSNIHKIYKEHIISKSVSFSSPSGEKGRGTTGSVVPNSSLPPTSRIGSVSSR